MNSAELINLNSKNLIQERADSGRVAWKWPLAIVFARLFFALFAQSLIATLFFIKSSSPYQAAADWWPVYGTLIDLGCLILIIWQLKKEGLRFRDLLNLDPRHLALDILLGLCFILWVFPLAIAGITGCSLLIFGSPHPPAIYHPLPIWAAAYSLLIFPVVWGLTEQCTYQGYALARLEALLPHPAFAIAMVAFGWGIQHIALPLIFDWHYMLYRFLSFLPLAVVMTIVYLRTRRLIPFIIAHSAVDMLGVLSGIIMPMLVK